MKTKGSVLVCDLCEMPFDIGQRLSVSFQASTHGDHRDCVRVPLGPISEHVFLHQACTEEQARHQLTVEGIKQWLIGQERKVQNEIYRFLHDSLKCWL